MVALLPNAPRAAAHNAQVERERTAYEAGQTIGVSRTMTRVLMNSKLPREFHATVELQFDQSHPF